MMIFIAALMVALPADVTVDDLARFPDRQTTAVNLRFADAYLTHVRQQYPLSPRHVADWYAHEHEAELLRDCWQALDWAHDWTGEAFAERELARFDEDCMQTLLRRLRELRKEIGSEAYALGDMPPSVPLWRY